jgi:tetratricopeptide (TPR) repeat protein
MAIITKEDLKPKAKELFDRGFSALDRGNLDYAMDMLLGCLELEPGFLEGRTYLRAAAVRKFKEGKNGKLAQAMGTAAGMPKIIAARANLAKKPLSSLQTAEELLRKNPLNPQFVYLLCDAAVALNMPEVAVQSLEIIRDHSEKDDPDMLYRLAQAYLENEQPQEARAVFERVMTLKPNNQDLIKEYKDITAIATMKQGGWGSADSYRDIIKDSAEAATIEQELKVVKTEDDISALVKDARSKIEQEPDNINYRRALADLFTKAGRFEEAIEALQEAQVATGGSDPQVDRALSTVHVRVFDRDITKLREAGDETGTAALEQKKIEFQFEDTRSRVERYPNDREFKYEYGVMLFERGEHDEAIKQLQLARQNPNRRISALFYLARCFKAKKQYDLARDQLQQAAGELHTMDNMKKSIVYELGDLCERTGEKESAINYFKEIYSVDIGYKDVAEKIEQAYE